MSDFYQIKDNGIELYLVISANGRKNQVIGYICELQRLKVKVASPPVDGKANEILIKYLAKEFSFPKSYISVIKGKTTKFKTIFITLDSAEVKNFRKKLDLYYQEKLE